MSEKAQLSEHDFATEVERLLWSFENPTPDLAENLGYLKNLLEEHDASTRAHVSLAEALLKSTVWADHDELSQNLLWALYTLHDQDYLWLGTDLIGKRVEERKQLKPSQREQADADASLDVVDADKSSGDEP